MRDTVRLAGVLAMTAGSLFAAGCGGGGRGGATGAAGATAGPAVSSPVPSATVPAPAVVPRPKGGTGGGDPSLRVLNAHSAFTLCLQRQGIPLSAARLPQLSPRQQIAVRRCAAPLPGGVNGGVLPAVAKFRTCMKGHGTPLPAAGRPVVLATADPKVAAAVAACSPLLSSTRGTT